MNDGADANYIGAAKARAFGCVRWSGCSCGYRPIRAGGLDEAFGLAIGLGRVGLGEEMADAVFGAGFAENLPTGSGRRCRS